MCIKSRKDIWSNLPKHNRKEYEKSYGEIVQPTVSSKYSRRNVKFISQINLYTHMALNIISNGI